MAGINVGAIEADLAIDSKNLERGLAGGRLALTAIEREVKQLQADMASGAIGTTEYGARLSALVATEARLTAAMQSAYTATTQLHTGLEVAGKSADAMTNRAARMGQGMMQAGYALDDLQYGFRGISNNLQPVTTSLLEVGGVAMSTATSIGAAVAVVGIAVYQLYTHWDQLMDLVGTGRVRTEAEEMEELAKKTGRTADETARLNKFKREEADIAEMLAKRPKGEREAEEARQKAIVEAGSAEVKAGITKTLLATGRGEKMTPAEAAEIAQIEKFKAEVEPGSNMAKGYEKILAESRAKIQARIEAANDKLTEEYLKPKNLDTLIKLVGANPGAFPAGILKDLEDLKPENRKQQAAWEAEGLSNEQRAQEAADQRKADEQEGKVAGRARTAAEKKAEAAKKAQEKAIEEEYQYESQRLDDSNAEWEKAQDRRKQRRRENLKTAKEELPGVEKMAESAVLESKVRASMGMKAGSPVDAIKERLIAAGMDEKAAQAAAEDLTGEAGRKVGEKVTGAMIGEKEMPIGRSEQFTSAAELAAKVQAGVGQDTEEKKHTSQFDKMITHLARLAERRENLVSFDITQ